MLRAAGARFAGGFAGGCRPGGATDGGDPSQSHGAIDAQQRGAGRLRRREGACRRGHLGACAGAAGDSRQRAGRGTSCRRRGGGPGGDRPKTSNWSTSIRATPARWRPKRLPPTGSSSRSSNSPWPGAASSSCPDAGSSNDPSAGRLASAASPATTNASPLPSLVSTGSPSPASCSAASSTQVHDSL